MDIDEQELTRLYEHKRQLLRERGHYTLRQLEDAFHQRKSGTYLKDVIFGANDGIVTTFAVVAGATGASLPGFVVIILGFANLVGDGISMGLGNYLGERSDALYDKGQRQKEFWEIERFPAIEQVEVRGILRDRWGFEGPLLEQALATITKDPKRWVDFMMREELDIIEPEGMSGAAKHGLAIFIAFSLAGLIPLIPFLVPGLPNRFVWSVLLAGLAFFTLGSLRAKLAPIRWWVAGLEVFLIGSLASGSAYLIGKLLERIAH